MSVSLAVIFACVLSGLGVFVGLGLQLKRHGIRPPWSWLLLPIGALMTFAFIPVSIGLTEGAWAFGDLRLWAAVGIGSAGVLGQVGGWPAVLRPRLRPTQCSACEYEMGGMLRCPECGWRRDLSDP
jgi:hypothetical protein